MLRLIIDLAASLESRKTALSCVSVTLSQSSAVSFSTLPLSETLPALFGQTIELLVQTYPKLMLPVNPPGERLGRENAVQSGRGTRYYVPDFEGCLSIKSVVNGTAVWGDGTPAISAE